MPQHILRFAIPSVDQLLGERLTVQHQAGQLESADDCYGIGVGDNETVSICLIGGDGTGKSVLAMHLASDYANLTSKIQARPRVIYASTDLSLGRARRLWNNFALGYPETRIVDPFDRADTRKRIDRPKLAETIELKELDPLSDDALQFSASGPPAVQFLDLATKTAGDDWAFLNRLTASLPPHESGSAPYPHLLVIDAVEGLEVLVGKTDAYGERRDRRSRLAQMIRAAAGKCHLVFLVEESRNRSKTAEEFVSDSVIRLGFRKFHGYSRRIIRVEKVRGQSHVRGSHDLAIRTGKGSTTGRQVNFDDPEVIHPQQGVERVKYYELLRSAKGQGVRPSMFDKQAAAPNRASQSPAATHQVADDECVYQSYVHVFQSLHHSYRNVMERLGTSVVDAEIPLVDFGIRYLDELLTPPDSKQRSTSTVPTSPRNGVRANVPIALIGEEGTSKTRLSRAFLSRAFDARDPVDSGVVVYLTTQFADHERLAEKLKSHFRGTSPVEPHRVICRRLEVHNMPPAVFLHIVREAVREAQQLLWGDEDIPKSESLRRMRGHKIRLVINNWSIFRDIHPEIEEDHKVLPALLFFLQRESIATVIVANEEQGFRNGTDLRRAHDLREHTGAHIYTWHVPFFGEGRIAISAGYRLTTGRRAHVIRELRPLLNSDHVRKGDDPTLGINPSFELYDGLEKGDPKYVDLKVFLYGEPGEQQPYVKEIKTLFSRLLHGIVEDKEFLVPQSGSAYESLRNFSELQGASRFPYTLVLQVDEFWAKTGPLHLALRNRYLEAVTATSTRAQGATQWTHDSHLVEDTLRFFQPSIENITALDRASPPPTEVEREWRRCDFFSTVGYDLEAFLQRKAEVVKVPYTWDFGFLMCAKKAWEAAAQDSKLEKIKLEVVQKVWHNLPRIDSPFRGASEPVTWADFIEATDAVAESAMRLMPKDERSEWRKYVPFAIAPEHQESLCCLLLEIWASEVESSSNTSPLKKVFQSARHEETSQYDLAELAEAFSEELHKAVILISKLFKPEAFEHDNQLRSTKTGWQREIPVAARHWYASAVELQKDCLMADTEFVAVGLPGSFSVRGDWFLAVARGSRSVLMGDRAIDLLSTRRANIARLQTGVGLPVRDATPSAAELWTAILKGDPKDDKPTLDQPKDTPPKCPRPKVHYSELIQLGGPSGKDNASDFARGQFRWLWRSRIKHYDRHSRIVRRWLCRMLRNPKQIETLADFNAAVDQFRQTLGRATISTGGDEG